MMQSSERIHGAVVMDGNGRWAARRGLPRWAGHRAGATAVRRVVEAAPSLGIGTLTLYAFSSDNWKRPLVEVSGLMRLFEEFLASEQERCVENRVRLNVIGRRDRLAPKLVTAIEAAERATAAGDRLLLRVAVDYSGRDAIRRAAQRLAATERSECSLDDFATIVGAVDYSVEGVPPLDILIRTGGECRLSDFMLWEAAYAELFFREELWPDFGADELRRVVEEYRTRDRRFGGLGTGTVFRPAATSDNRARARR